MRDDLNIRQNADVAGTFFTAWFNPAVFGVTRLWRQVFNLPGPQPASWETCRHSCYPVLNHAFFTAWFNPAVFGVTRLWRQVFNLPGPQPASWETCRHSCYPVLNHAFFTAWFNPAVFGVTRLWRQVFNLPGPQPASWETCRHSCYPVLNHAFFTGKNGNGSREAEAGKRYVGQEMAPCLPGRFNRPRAARCRVHS